MKYLNNNLISAGNRFVNGSGMFIEVSAKIDDLIHECKKVTHPDSQKEFAVEIKDFIENLEIAGANKLSSDNNKTLEDFKKILLFMIF
jgi:hypothetical protein